MFREIARWFGSQQSPNSLGRRLRRRRISAEVTPRCEALEFRWLPAVAPLITRTGKSVTNGTFSIYEDLNGDGIKAGDTPLHFGIPVQVTTSTFRRGSGDITSYRQRTMTNGAAVKPTVSTMTFYDSNANGEYDNGETVVYSRVVSERNLYTFQTEIHPNGQTWIKTSSTSSRRTTRESYIRQYTVRGSAYEDINANGRRDMGEPGFPGAIFVDLNGDKLHNDDIRSPLGGTIFTYTSSKSDGTFEGILQGRGKLHFGSRQPPELAGQQVQTILEGAGRYNPPGPGDNRNLLDNLVFGVFRNGIVQGNVFSDLDRDGKFHPGRGETPIAGVKMWLEQNGKRTSTKTDKDGYFMFFATPGKYRVFQDLSDLGVSQSLPSDERGYSGKITRSGQSVSYTFGFGRTTGAGKDISVSSATRQDSKGVDFTYKTAGNPGFFELALFRSADTSWDSGDVKLGASIMATPSSGAVTGTGRFDFSTDYVHDPDRPYLIVVADPQKRVSEVAESNNARSVERLLDVAPFKIVGTLTYDARSDQFKTDGTAQVGFKPVDGEPFVPLVTGNVVCDEEQIQLKGSLASSYGGQFVPLFVGTWNINVKTASTSSFLAVSSLYKLVGLSFDFKMLQLVNPEEGSALDSYLDVQGELTAPALLGRFTVSLEDPNYIHLGPRARGISATIPLGKGEIEINGVSKLEVEDAAVTYLSSTEQNPDGAFRLQGKFTVRNETLEDEEDNAPSLDISGSNYIEFGTAGVYFIGAFGIKNWSISEKYLMVRSGTLFFDTVNEEWKIDGELQFKRLTDKTLILGAGFLKGDFNYFRVGVDDIDYPTPIAGIFLNKVVLSADNISGQDKDALEISATVGLSEGPKIPVPAMPLIGVEAHNAHIATMEVTGTGSKEHLGGSVEFVYLTPKLLKVNGAFDWNWQKNQATLSGTVDAFAGSLTGAASITVDQRGVIGSGEIKGTLKVPDTGPFKFRPVLDAVVRAYFQYSGKDNNSANDYAAFSTDVTLPLLGRKTIAVRVTTDGGMEFFIGMVSLENLEGQSGMASGGSSKLSQAAVGTPDTFTVPTGTKQLLVSSTWKNSADSVRIELVRPDGSVLSEDQLNASNAALIPEMTSRTSRAIAMLKPMPGQWKIRLVSAKNLGVQQFAALREGVSPRVEVLNAVVKNRRASIRYRAIAPDSNSTVTLFYDTDRKGFDGKAIIGNLRGSTGEVTYNWDLSRVPDGKYYVYAMITDGYGVSHFDYYYSPVIVDTVAPVFKPIPSFVSIAEDTVEAMTVVATDISGPVMYSLAGGQDASKFRIDATTGKLSFLVAPDFESPGDIGADNSYNVIVRASDSQGNNRTQHIELRIKDVATSRMLSHLLNATNVTATKFEDAAVEKQAGFPHISDVANPLDSELTPFLAREVNIEYPDGNSYTVPGKSTTPMWGQISSAPLPDLQLPFPSEGGTGVLILRGGNGSAVIQVAGNLPAYLGRIEFEGEEGDDIWIGKGARKRQRLTGGSVFLSSPALASDESRDQICGSIDTDGFWDSVSFDESNDTSLDELLG